MVSAFPHAQERVALFGAIPPRGQPTIPADRVCSYGKQFLGTRGERSWGFGFWELTTGN